MINLLGKFGRRPVRYTYSSEMRKYSRPCAISPTQSREDDTDYRTSEPLTPGIKVTGLSMSSTAGVLLKHNDGRQRVTVALHAFYDSHSVFHPNRLPPQYLGEIRERYYGPGIGLFELSPGNQFSNATYFNANPPKRLVDTAYASENISWFEVDGYTGGKISLLYEGPRVRKRDLPEEIINMHSLSIQRDCMFYYCGIDKVEIKRMVRMHLRFRRPPRIQIPGFSTQVPVILCTRTRICLLALVSENSPLGRPGT